MRAEFVAGMVLMVAGVLPSPAQSFARTGWIEDFEAAKAKAKTENRFMLLNFTGSDWCGWCIKLEDEVFSRDDFGRYAEEKLVLVELDFPRRSIPAMNIREQNARLKSRYGIRGYPTIIILDPNGEQVGRTGYRPGGAGKYVEHLEEIIRPHESGVSAVSGRDGADDSGVDPDEVRTWSSTSGSSVYASYDRIVGNVVQLRQPNGRQIRIGLASLSESDQDFLRSINAVQ